MFETHIPHIQAEHLDTTGAGDAFVGGYLAALVQDESPKACVEAGIKLSG